MAERQKDASESDLLDYEMEVSDESEERVREEALKSKKSERRRKRDRRLSEESERSDFEERMAKLVEAKTAPAMEEVRKTSATLQKLMEMLMEGKKGEASASGNDAEMREPVSTPTSSGCCRTARSGGDWRLGMDIVEPFDPSDVRNDVEGWLERINQLAAIHKWEECERVCLMQAKLKGEARSWFNQLDRYDLTWEEWQRKLKAAFPRGYDFFKSVEELVLRRKGERESMTQYYHAKLAQCGRCGITGENAVSCIIGGLPAELQANARAAKCKTPDELYTSFLVGLDGYKGALLRRTEDVRSRVEARGAVPRASVAVPREREEKRNEERRGERRTEERKIKVGPQLNKVRCYNCQEWGTHLGRECTKPPNRRCLICSGEGHFAAQCPKKTGGRM